MRRLGPGLLVAGLAACTGGGGGGGGSGGTAGTTGGTPDLPDPSDEVLDPQSCKECHPKHFAQWQGSMHAYAADDPVFLAMNARGQRETQGALGDFCIGCHAPLAVQLGLTQDGLNLDEVPQHLKGVTCYFCHNTTDVTDTHNNPLTLAWDRVMRGNVSDPVDSEFHESAYEPGLDGRTLKSGDVCGACHDIVTPSGLHLERTYDEWLGSFYSNPDPMQPKLPDQMFFGQTCANCHMDGTKASTIADAPGVAGNRTYHDHRFAGVDVALTPFPDEQTALQYEIDQREAIDKVRQTVLCASLCVQPTMQGDQVVLWLHNEFAGHHWPSGANQDRRAWAEVIVRGAGGAELFASGVVPDGVPAAEVAAQDPDMWLFRDLLRDDAGEEVHMFWDARTLEASQLPVADTFFGDPTTWRKRVYPVASAPIERVTVRVRLRPMGLEVIDSLIASGDLDPAIRDAFETFDIPPTVLTWIPPDANDPGAATLSEAYGSCVSSSPVCASPFITCERLTAEETCTQEAACSWVPGATEADPGRCHGCPTWTNATTCEDASYCRWDGNACVFEPCADLTEATCNATAGCAWDGAECGPA